MATVAMRFHPWLFGSSRAIHLLLYFSIAIASKWMRGGGKTTLQLPLRAHLNSLILRLFLLLLLTFILKEEEEGERELLRDQLLSRLFITPTRRDEELFFLTCWQLCRSSRDTETKEKLCRTEFFCFSIF
jgi:hypothetical protein